MTPPPPPNPPQSVYINSPAGTGIPWQPFTYLYFHIKKSDQKLFDAFKKIENYIQTLIAVETFPGGAVSGSSNVTFSVTFDLNDLTPGVDIAPVVQARSSGTIFEVSIIAKQTLTADLVVTLNKTGSPVVTITWAYINPAFTLVVLTTGLSNTNVVPTDYFTCDINSSDGSSSYTGVATLVVKWQ